MTKKKTPFDYVNAINRGVDIPIEGGYSQYVTNRALSQFPDTILLANEANMRWHHMTDEQHFSLLRGIVRAGYRRPKPWPKVNKTGRFKILMDYYPHLSAEKAKEMVKFFPEETLDIMEKELQIVTM